MQQPTQTQRSGNTPQVIDPKEFPALEDLRVHCRVGGTSMLDRVYTDALKMHKLLKEAQAKKVYGGKLIENLAQSATRIRTEDPESLL
jgi:hypothetical protein